MVCCFAFGCKHVSSRNDCRMFRFPADEKEREKWEKLCRRADRELQRSYDRLCSCHFKDGIKQNGPSIFSYDDPLVKIINNKRTPFSTRRRKLCRYDSESSEGLTDADKCDETKPFEVQPMIIELEGTPQKLPSDGVTVESDEHSLLGISGDQSPSLKSPTVNVQRPHPLLRAALANVESVPQFPEIVSTIHSGKKVKKQRKKRESTPRVAVKRLKRKKATSKLTPNPAIESPANGDADGNQTFDKLRREAYAVAADNEIWRVLDDTPDYLTVGTLQAHQTFISVIVTAADLQAEVAVYGIPRRQKDSLLCTSLRDYLDGLAAMSVCPGIEDENMQPYGLLPSNSTQNEFFRHIIYTRQGDGVTHSSRIISNFCARLIETSEALCTQCELVYKLILAQ